ncbi:MAG: radical SAM protein [Desulfatitalea sp.]
MLHIGFILPSSDYLFDPFRGDPHTHYQILTVLEYAFGDQIRLSLIDLRGIQRQFAQYRLKECDLYLHSVYTLDYSEQQSIVHTLRERYPRAKHIAGGPHATVFSEECLKLFDALIIGDGEDAVIEAVSDILENKELKLVYKQQRLVDINLYPYPLRKWLPEATVARKGLLNLRRTPGLDQLLSTTVIFSRGCPYSCAFCAMPQIKKFNAGVRYRAPYRIEEEIEYLKRVYHIQAISLLDEIGFPAKREEAIAHLEAIGRTDIKWRAQCRVDSITPEIAELLKQSGCVTMCLGVESVSQLSLDLIHKKISVPSARQSIRMLKEKGIECRVYMILGLPGEPKDIVEQTWEFIKETDPELVYLSLLTLRPGTEMYTNFQKYGIKSVSTNWDNTMHLHGRYEFERPSLTFEYQDNPDWGTPLSPETIVNNYMELQSRIKEGGYGPL